MGCTSSSEGPQISTSFLTRQSNIDVFRKDIKNTRESLIERYDKLAGGISGTGKSFTVLSKWMNHVERPGQGSYYDDAAINSNIKSINDKNSRLHEDVAVAQAARIQSTHLAEQAILFGQGGDAYKPRKLAVEHSLRALVKLEEVTWPSVAKLGVKVEDAFAAYRKQYFRVKDKTEKYDKEAVNKKSKDDKNKKNYAGKMKTHMSDEEKKEEMYNRALKKFDQAYEAAISESARVGRETVEMWESQLSLYLNAFTSRLGASERNSAVPQTQQPSYQQRL